MECPFCETKSVNIITKADRTKFCKCEKCGEEFVPAKMMDENLEILRKRNRYDTTATWESVAIAILSTNGE